MRAPPRKVYQIGPFRLDVFERTLMRDGEAVALFGKAFDTLVALVEGAGTLQTQQSLLDRIWPNVIVEPNSLQQNISLIRRALADEPGVKIVTVRGRGYRLIGDVREVPNAPSAAGDDRASNREVGLPPQRTHCCFAHDGARLAYARLGTGRPLVKVANWLSHLELDWHSPIWRHWLQLLSGEHCLVRYDARGNGLSDWRPPTIHFSDFVMDLASVFDGRSPGVRRRDDGLYLHRDPARRARSGASVAGIRGLSPARADDSVHEASSCVGWIEGDEQGVARLTLDALGARGPRSTTEQVDVSPGLRKSA